MRGSSEAGLGNRSGDARDLGGGIAAGGGAHPVPKGGLGVSLPNAGALRLPEASQGRGDAAAGVPAMHHEALVGADRAATRNLPSQRPPVRPAALAGLYTGARHQGCPICKRRSASSASRARGPPGLGSRRIDAPRRPRKSQVGYHVNTVDAPPGTRSTAAWSASPRTFRRRSRNV